MAPTAVAAVMLLLAACGDGAGTPGDRTSPDATPGVETPSPSSTGSPPAAGSPGPSAPSDRATDRPLPPPGTVVPPGSPAPTVTRGEQTISGRVTPGVEPNCLLLETSRGQYLLFGAGVDQLRSGQQATVRGEIMPDLATTCQQGTPFQVAEIID